MSSQIESYEIHIKLSEQIRVQTTVADEVIGTVRKDSRSVITYPGPSRLDDDRLARLQQFQGEVVVMTDTETASVAEYLAAQLYASRIGTFIGDPTGGGGSVPGNYLSFELPSTRLGLIVSAKMFFLPKSDMDHLPGVVPHHWVKQTFEGFRQGRDTVMEFVRAMWS